MSTNPIDYAALAKQAGAISSTPASVVDYAALAKQAGAISSTSTTFHMPNTQGRRLPDGSIETSRVATPRSDSQQALETQGSVLSGPVQAGLSRPVSTGDKVANLLPGGLALKRLLIDPQLAEADKAQKTSGLESFGHSLASAVPIVGPMAAAAAESWNKGEKTAAGLQAIGALAGAHQMAPTVSEVLKMTPKAAAEALSAAKKVSPRGAMSERMNTVPAGEQFTRQQVLDAARAEGINLDLAQATDSKVAGAVKRVNQYSLTGQGSYEANATKNLSALEQWAQKETQRYSPEGTSRELVGSKIQSALRDDLAAKKAAASEAFDDLDKRGGGNVINGTDTVEAAARNIVSGMKDYYAKHPELKPKQAWSIIENLSKRPEVAVKDATGTVRVQEAPTHNFTWSELHQLRSDLMDVYRNNPDIIKGKSEAWLQQLVGTIDQSMTDASAGMSPADLAQFRKANATWENIKSTYDNVQSPLYHAVRSANASQVPGMLSKPTPELARQVRSMLGSLEGPFQRQFVENILTSKDGTTLDLRNLNSKLSRIDNEHLVAMLGEDGAKNLRLLGKVSQKVTWDSNPSGTAKSAVPMAEVVNAFSNPVAGGLELGGNYATAKGMNSPALVDFLTRKPSEVLRTKPSALRRR